jgi:chromosome segregation ATPase
MDEPQAQTQETKEIGILAALRMATAEDLEAIETRINNLANEMDALRAAKRLIETRLNGKKKKHKPGPQRQTDFRDPNADRDEESSDSDEATNEALPITDRVAAALRGNGGKMPMAVLVNRLGSSLQRISVVVGRNVQLFRRDENDIVSLV